MKLANLGASVAAVAAFSASAARVQQRAPLPADESTAVARLNASPRHGEYVTIDAGNGDSVKLWVVYPERRDKAPVVVVIHEIFGLSDWIRAVGDQLAADGFIAIVPDLLSGHGPHGGGTDSLGRQGAVAAIGTLPRDEIIRRVNAAARYGRSLPAAKDRVGTVGFCWGGGWSFQMAALLEGNRAAVVYYGPNPDSTILAQVRAPVLGLFGGDDARVGASIPAAKAYLDAHHKPYDVHSFEGAGHGFLRDQGGRGGANLRAAQQAWPMTIAFFRDKLGR